MHRLKNQAGETIAFQAASLDDFLLNKAAVSSKDGKLVKVLIFSEVSYHVIDAEEGSNIVLLSPKEDGKYHEPLVAFAVKEMMSKEYREKCLPKDGVYSHIVLGYKNTLKHPFVLHVVSSS